VARPTNSIAAALNQYIEQPQVRKCLAEADSDSRRAHGGVPAPGMHDPGNIAMRALTYLYAERMHRGTLFLMRMCVVPHHACVHRASPAGSGRTLAPCHARSPSSTTFCKSHTVVAKVRGDDGDCTWRPYTMFRSSASVFGSNWPRRCLP
jgi:hypothetical protein